MESVSSCWEFSPEKGFLRRESRFWKLPREIQWDLAKLYLWLTIPLSVVLIPALFSFPLYFQFAEFIEAFGFQKFALRYLVSILVWVCSFFIYFWPVLLSIRKPLIIWIRSEELQINENVVHVKDISSLQITLDIVKTQHGKGIAKETFTHRFYRFQLQTKSGLDFSISFRKNALGQLRDFAAYLEKKLGIPCPIKE